MPSSDENLIGFWNDVRALLLPEYGQEGRRSKEMASRRKALSSEIRVPDATMRGFLNGHQKSLGDGPRRRLCAKRSEIATLYANHCADESVPEAADDAAKSSEQGIQLTLQFDGFGPDEPIAFRIPPDSQGQIVLKFRTG